MRNEKNHRADHRTIQLGRGSLTTSCVTLALAALAAVAMADVSTSAATGPLTGAQNRVAPIGAVPFYAAPTQDEEPAAPKTEPPTESGTKPRTDSETTDSNTNPPPSLDELLGIDSEDEDGEGAGEGERVADLEAEAELRRRLDEEKVGNAFAEALQKMAIVADLLDKTFDTGLGTQRVQEEVISKLQLLLESAKKKQSSGGGGSGASSASQSSQPKPTPGKQGGQGEKQGQRSDDPASESTNADPPSPRSGEMNTVFEEARSEWGSLPQRVRDMLLQGRKEKFSSLYEQLTREYYRRLAEEGSP